MNIPLLFQLFPTINSWPGLHCLQLPGLPKPHTPGLFSHTVSHLGSSDHGISKPWGSKSDLNDGNHQQSMDQTDTCISWNRHTSKTKSIWIQFGTIASYLRNINQNWQLINYIYNISYNYIWTACFPVFHPRLGSFVRRASVCIGLPQTSSRQFQHVTSGWSTTSAILKGKVHFKQPTDFLTEMMMIVSFREWNYPLMTLMCQSLFFWPFFCISWLEIQL